MRRLISLFVAVLLISAAFGQTRISLGDSKTEMKLKSATQTSVQLETKMQSLNFRTMLTDEGEFEGLNLDNLQKDHGISPGAPDLPVYAELLEVPYGAEIVATVIDYDETIYNLNDLGLQKISPAQPSLSKSTDPESVQFEYDAALYSTDSWIEPEIVSTSYQGVMRGVPIGQVVVRPFRYNPATNELSVLSNIKLDISFENADLGLTMDQKSKYYSPQFSGVYNMLLNYEPPANKDTFTDYPIKYVIVADPAFETTLQPFIEWKTKSGYNVIEAYTDDPAVGSTTTSIQSYLQGLYDAGNASDPAPTYVLIVGDHDGNYNIPAFGTQLGGYDHVTDVYYGCYDGGGDNIPDLYLGRMSANTTTELQHILDKILPYEMYTIPDGTYLDRCILIAGVDGTFAPTHGDGTISYGIREYFNEAHGFTDIFAYYYSYTSGDYHVMSSNDAGASSSIISNLSDGVGFANYTAHCMQYGWADPAVVNDDIAGLNNVDEYAFMIGNCCLSFKFNHADYDAFGEQLLYAENKGAINYIGTSNNSLWDEDVYWGIGLTSLGITQANVTNHNFSNTGQGAYDGVMHEHGESFDEWFFTGGQMVFAANTQVQSSTSGNKQYYWEIYHNSGDPSLMPFLTQPEAMTVSYSAPMIGNTSLNVSCEPYTYVAISQNGVLLDAKWSGASNSVTLSFPALTADGASVVATKQDRVPHINDFTPIAPDPPTADFSGTPTTILEGESVTFTDLSTYAVEWDWSFGDGGTSTEANPVYTYNTAGTYTVSLTVTNPIDSDTHTKTDYIIVNPNTNPPASDFVADQTTVTIGTTVNFTDLSANFPTSWEWTFDGGDIASSTDQNPSVVYNTPGTYTVELTASNGYGQGTTETKVDYITVTLPNYCDAGSNDDGYEYISNVELGSINNGSAASTYTDFSAISTDALAEDNLNLNVTVTNGYVTDFLMVWADWNRDGDFADANEEIWTSAQGTGPYSSTITVPAGTTPGPVRVRLRLQDDDYSPVYDACGFSGYGEVEDYTINVQSPTTPPTANFTASPTSTCDGIVQFADASLNADTWAWDFGDGNVSNDQNPLHTYTSNGTYTVMLTVTNAYGNDSHTEVDYVVVDMPVAPSVTDAENCGPADMTLTASGTGGTLNWYDAPTGGNLVNTGTSLVDNFTATTSYYVSETVAGATHNAGLADNTAGGQYYGGANDHGCVFNALTDFVIETVTVYADGAGDRTIQLRDNGDNVLEELVVTLVDGENQVDLFFPVTTGTNYKLVAIAPGDLFYNNAGVTYPYEVADVLSIINSTENTNFYIYFYNWVVSEGGCESARTQVTATVHDIPTVDLGANQTICETDDYTFDAGAGFSNYAWSNSSNGQSITVNTADVYSVTVTDANGCEAEDAVELFVDAMPTIAIDAVGDLCENESALTLSATPAGGTWSGSGVSGNQFDPSIGAGDHAITYEVTNGECTATDNISIHVDAMPDASINAVGPFCAGDAAVTLTATTAGGSWTGNGVTGDQFDPAAAGIGSHIITYEVDNGACTDTDQITIDVSANADATIDAVADLCETDAAITLTAATAGGTWSGDGVVGDEFDPASAGAGDHLVTYTISGACGDSDQITIHVDAMPSISITDPGAFCTGDAAVILSATPVGGTWTGTGISGDQFDPAVAGLGNHTISYEVTSGTCTATEDIILYVSDGYDATINAVADLCETDSPITLTAADGGGTWSGDGVVGDTFDPTSAGEGDHIVTYTIAGSCGDTDQTTIHVDAMPDASINAVGPFCAGDAAVTLTATTAGGSWTGNGVTGDQFDPAAAGIGSHVITYEVDNGVCTATDQITIDVNAYADATINAVADLCETDAPITLTAADAGGTWSGGGVTGDTFDPAVAGEGDHVITYTIAGLCGDTDQTTIHVDAMPDASINAVGPFCAGDAAVTLTASTSGGTWSGDGVTGDQFDPAAAGIGSHEITYQVSNGTCTDNDMIEIVVSDYFDASITPVDDMCSTDAAISLNAADAGGTWSGDGVTGDTFDPAVAGEGDHIVTYTIAGSCGDTDQITIHVDAMPDASITHPGDFCVGDDPVVLTATETGGTWSGDGVVGDTFDPSVAGLGVYTITYTIENGVCSDSDDVTVVVGEEPVVTVDITNASSSTAEDGAATLNISGGISPYTILWSTGDETATVENLAAGTYSVMVTDAAGCSTNVPVLIDFTNSIADESLQIKLYPNPAKTALYIETNPNMVSRVELVNMLGQSIMTDEINGTITVLDVSEYVSGVYFVRIYAVDGEQHINRVVID
jgi:PKD repeat protein